MEDDSYKLIHSDHEPKRNLPSPYPCLHCDKLFTTPQGLGLHIKWIHPEVIKTPHQCHVCHKVFPYQYYLKRHLEDAHSAFRPYSCSICDYNCKSESNFKRHLKIHKENRERFKCSKCGKDYAWKSHLKLHLKTKHGSLNNERISENDNLLDNSNAFGDEAHNRDEASAELAEAAQANISIAVSDGVPTDFFTVDYNPPAGSGWTGSQTTDIECPFGVWDCHCGNMYASQEDLERHCNEDHKLDCKNV